MGTENFGVITVTEEDIANGKRNRAKECALALAITRKVQKPLSVVGGKSSISSHIGAVVWIENKPYPLPVKVAEFMINFDMGLKVIPFNFEL